MTTGDFYEEQKFDQKWIVYVQYLLLLSFLAISIAAIVTGGAGPLPGSIPFLAAAMIVLLFRTIKLQTRITKEGIYYRFFPIHRRYRMIRRCDIIEIGVRTYDPLGDYGGWGIRIGRYGRAVTIKGNMGIFITFGGKKNILIGTSKPGEVERFLKEHRYS